MIKNYLLIAFGLIIILLLGLRACTPNPMTPKQIIIHDTLKVLETKIVETKKEVVKWKKIKGEIEYVTTFDTLATIDTVIVELIKCDKEVKTDSIIIAALDSTVASQDIALQFKDKQIKYNKKTTRKEKRKAFFAGLGIGYVLGLLTPL